MVTIKVKGGTPQGSETLCRTCSYGHIIKGFRATEEEVYCRYFYLEREIHFPVLALLLCNEGWGYLVGVSLKLCD
jgi:hypothetical protein